MPGMAFDEQDVQAFSELLAKLRENGWPIPPEAFHAVCETFITNPVELALTREGEHGAEIFLTHRSDEYFTGWHIPGTVLRPGENAEQALKRLIEHEIGAVVSAPALVRAYDRMKGSGEGECPRGQEVARVYHARFTERHTVKENDAARFFLLDGDMSEVIPLHRPLIQFLQETLR